MKYEKCLPFKGSQNEQHIERMSVIQQDACVEKMTPDNLIIYLINNKSWLLAE